MQSHIDFQNRFMLLCIILMIGGIIGALLCGNVLLLGVTLLGIALIPSAAQ